MVRYFILNFRYDGGAIGGFLRDALQNITGSLYIQGLDYSALYIDGTGALSAAGRVDGKGINGGISVTSLTKSVSFDASRVVNTAAETRGASVSAWIGITY